MDVLLAVLPFADVKYPALGVSLLKAHAEGLGLDAHVRYLNFDLAERMGEELYGVLAQLGGSASGLVGPAVVESLIGEWFFADVAFPELRGRQAAYIRDVLGRQGLSEHLPRIREARRHRRALVAGWARAIQRAAPRVVGFTTTFHQTCACLAVARRLKRLARAPIILFGGANCEGEMGRELLRSFPWIDFVCAGEGDVAVPRLLERLLRGRGDGAPIPGILERGRPATLGAPARVADLDTLPVPDYTDYFTRLRASPLAGRVAPRLPIETARGCWWGARQHCTFCGLNGEGMAFRSKSAARAGGEIRHLVSTYGVRRVDAVDNILDLRYLPTLFRDLARRGPRVELFFETKANLRYEQLRALRAAGVRQLQPGLESFSDEALGLMRKGCSALQNLQFLRWCQELGIGVGWNILYGFPGESPAEVERMAQLLPRLVHLPPPWYCGPIRLDRFSPLFLASEAHGLARVRPLAAYAHVFPLPEAALRRLAYFFRFEHADGRDPQAYAQGLTRAAAAWAEAHGGGAVPRLDLVQAGGVVLLSDTRPCATRPSHVLAGREAQAYLACDSALPAAALCRRLGVGAGEVRDLLAPLVDAGLMVEREGRYLSLAVWRHRGARRARPARAHARGRPLP